MPFDDERRETGIGFALSGGGFRATLFHLGSMWRLNELGHLARLDRVSSVSGGSIAAAVLAVGWRELERRDFSPEAFGELVVEPLARFCSRNVDAPAIGEGALLPRKSASDAVEEEYRGHLFGDVTLADLPDHPRFVFNATNFATGRSFRFSKPFAGDYRIGLIRNPRFRLSLAVTASSAFPPFLSPLIVEMEHGDFEETEGADLYSPEFHERLVLTDGGVYDNLGLETVWNRYDTLLVSDAGALLDLTPSIGKVWHEQAMRAFNIATDQSRALRKRALIDDYRRGTKGAYWGIRTAPASYGLAGDVMECRADRLVRLASMRTRLNRFDEAEQGELINWGYAICDTAMRAHVLPEGSPMGRWPYPKYALDRP